MDSSTYCMCRGSSFFPEWFLGVLDPHCLVGYPNDLASSCLLRSFNLREEGTDISPDRFNSCLWRTHLDTARVHASSFPFPYRHQELLGKHCTLSSSWMPSQAPTRRPSSCFPSYRHSHSLGSTMEASPPHSYSCYSSCYAWRHFVWLCDVWCYSLLSAPWST